MVVSLFKFGIKKYQLEPKAWIGQAFAHLRSTTLATWVDGDIKSFLVSGHLDEERQRSMIWRSETKHRIKVQSKKLLDDLYNL